MRRPFSLVGSLALLAVLLPGPALASVPDDQYQVLSARNASAAFRSIDGCLQTEVFVSSSDAVYGGRPGAVNKQGLTSLSVIVYDTCHPPEGKHFPMVFNGLAQDFVALASTSRLENAWVNTSFEMADEVSGRVVNARISLRWTLVGYMTHDTVHSHVRVPGDGIVNSHDNDLIGSAEASGTIVLAGVQRELRPSLDAQLELIKADCQKIVSPHQEFDSISCL
jgi:hypothetical protein